MAAKEAQARTKINKLLKESGWRFFDEKGAKANVGLVPNVKLTKSKLDDLGENFESTANGFIGFLLLGEQGYSLVVLEAKAEDKNPLLGKEQARKYAKAQEISKSTVATLKIPLSPLELQKEIEGYQKIIDDTRQVVENYQPRIPIHSDWPMVKLGAVCDVKSGGTPSRNVDSYWNGNIPSVTTTLIDFNIINSANKFITSEGLKESSTWIVPKGTVLMAMYGQGITRSKVAVFGIDAAINQACAAFMIKTQVLIPNYLFRILHVKYDGLRRISDRGGNQSNLSAQVLKQYSIPLPDLDTQRTIVAKIENEQGLVNANNELNRFFEDEIKATINCVWGEEIQDALTGEVS